MSLRLRLIAAILAALLVSLALGAGLACWRAARSVRSELAAAMRVGAQSLSHATGDPALLVAAFNGERHVVASLVDAQGTVTASSSGLQSERSAPHWFVWLVAPSLSPLRAAVAGDGAIVLRADPANEAAEAWTALGDSAADMLVFSILAGSLALATSGRALRPLAPLAAALDRVGPGQYDARLAPSGPPDLQRLTAGFNRMAGRLAAVETQNRRLTEQLLTIQDEERADLARDLHDEVGPFLFSISVSAASIERLAPGAAVQTQVALIREDVGHAQKYVRAMLARLRPMPPAASGLTAAIEDVAAFWRARHPGIDFRLGLGPALDEPADPVQDAAYRLVQEAVSNAVRHGAPQRVDIAVRWLAAGLLVRVADDGRPVAPEPGAGFGIGGMRERVAALGGTFFAGRDKGAGLWVVEARLPAGVA